MKTFPCALPEHMRERLHNDWPWPMSKLPRSLNARGPRCKGSACVCGGQGFKAWPPKLVKGFGVARWESNGAGSILEIAGFANVWIDAGVYGQEVIGVERNPGHPNFGAKTLVKLDWHAMPWADIDGGLAAYSPSALQKFSDKSWMQLDPGYTAGHRLIKRGQDGDDKALFWRYGWRPDHVDVYYNFGPYAGLKFE